jgi:hypothetical protein
MPAWWSFIKRRSTGVRIHRGKLRAHKEKLAQGV